MDVIKTAGERDVLSSPHQQRASRCQSRRAARPIGTYSQRCLRPRACTRCYSLLIQPGRPAVANSDCRPTCVGCISDWHDRRLAIQAEADQHDFPRSRSDQRQRSDSESASATPRDRWPRPGQAGRALYHRAWRRRSARMNPMRSQRPKRWIAGSSRHDVPGDAGGSDADAVRCHQFEFSEPGRRLGATCHTTADASPCAAIRTHAGHDVGWPLEVSRGPCSSCRCRDNESP